MSYDDAATYSAQQDSLPARVLAFFRQNPEEVLESADIAAKFAVPGSGSITNKMAPLVRMQLLKTERVGRVLHYSAGPELDAWPGATKLRRVPRPLEIRVTLHVHNAGTDRQRVEVMGVEP